MRSQAVISLAERINNALPQTQCTRCGYPDCHAYADAIADAAAPINQCPPGGAEGIARLAAITGREGVPLNPQNGIEGPRHVALIDEAWCIGCTLCIKACPVDAIIGAAKHMHTVIAADCTGCELCIAPCPVDCISLVPVTTATGWAAWSQLEADTARSSYHARNARLNREAIEQQTKLESKRAAHLQELDSAAPDSTDAQEQERKRAIIAAAMERARNKQ
jgi:Na+-translocating ferredoxin:NAD+ oxidoreductase subunit B